MPRCIAVLLASFLLVACAKTEVTPVVGPDGASNWFAISCKDDKGLCYAEAGRHCPWGYGIADQKRKNGVAASSAFGTTTIDGTSEDQMLVKCHSGPQE